VIRGRSVVGLALAVIGAAILSVPFACAQTALDTSPPIEARTGAGQPSPDSEPHPDGSATEGKSVEEKSADPRAKDRDQSTATSDENAPVRGEASEAQTAVPAEPAVSEPQQGEAAALKKEQAAGTAAPARTQTGSDEPASADGGETAQPVASEQPVVAAPKKEQTGTAVAVPAPAQTGSDDPASGNGSGTAHPVASEQPPAEKPLPDPKDVTLTIATWAGAYGQAQKRAFFQPFTKRFGYQLDTVTYDGDYEALEKQGDAPEWSLVDLNGEAMVRACDENRLERIDHSFLKPSPDGAPLSEDFLPGAVQPCGIASSAWSAIVIYDQRLAVKPTSLQDFFDTGKIPGKRLLPKQPRYSLELALMADGVAPDQVYATLATKEGQDRAFAKLSSIKDDILWWEKPSEVFDRIVKNEAVMGLAFNGRAFMAIVGAKQPLEILWDRQIYTFDYWAIPHGAKHQRVAKAFIGFATGPGPLADQARWIPYGPARRSAFALIGKHGELDLEMKPYLPTYEPNFSSALAFDGAFWRSHEKVFSQRFAEWVEGRQLPVQKEAALTRK
jgi:putative spermidine/putrescine transport system substrate-binding protein